MRPPGEDTGPDAAPAGDESAAQGASLVESLSSAEPVPAADESDAPIRFFLIADVRGYTRFTQAHGDEQAARLAARFAGLTREVVSEHQGVLLELRGDEALVVFTSARRALRAAVALQTRYVSETLADPSLPLGVGIGLDGGEAVEVEGGYRGGALNLAARLCSAAAAGDVLASQELVHMARVTEGIRYSSRGPMTFKGMATPAAVVEVLPELPDPARTQAFKAALAAGEPVAPAKNRKPALLAGALALAVLAALTAFVVRRNDAPQVALVANSIAIVNLGNSRVERAVAVGNRPTGITYGYGSAWSTNEGAGTVSRIDATTRAVVQTIAVGRSPRAISSGPSGVWVSNSDDRTVSWINPDVNTVVKTVPVGNGPAGLVATSDVVWVANSLDDTVSALSATNGAVLATIAVGERPTGIAVGEGAVWVANSGSATVSRIDPARRAVTDSVNVGNGAGAVAVGAGAVWVSNTLDGTVSRIEPSSNVISATIPAGRDPAGITVTANGVWVANEYGGTLARIDVKRNAVAKTVRLAARPREVVPVRGSLWVTTAGTPAVHRGGTLRALIPEGFIPSIDPALGYTYSTWGALTATNDGLVAYRRVGGPDGGTIVPDLATTVPKPTDGGRTYRFQLRRGIRYSDGQPVRPADFRRAAERQFAIGPVASLYAALLGGDACLKAPKTCHLDAGVVGDESAGTVTFHLSAPDPDLLDKLAMPWMYAVPASTPLTDVGTHPVPATGPYQISEFTPHRQVVLTRNPHFREWSHAAQPDGFPDRIVIGLVDDDEDATLTEAETGQADLIYRVAPERLPELTTRYPTGLHVDASPLVRFFLLNTTIPPFNDVRARRALAYAADRRALVNIEGGPQLASTSCQLLAPTFPAYKPFCDYTAHPSADGQWHGPDLATARRLVQQSGTAGMAVSVVSDREDLGRYLVGLLRSLGYRSTGTYGEGSFQAILPRDSKVQAGSGGWAADFPAPSGVLEALLGCSSPSNFAKFCDRTLEAQIARAKSLQLTDPGAAVAAWQLAERRAVADAAYVPIYAPSNISFTAARVGNVAQHPVFGPLLDQMWVRPYDRAPAVLTPHLDPRLVKVSTQIPFATKPTGTATGDVWLPIRDQGQLWRIDGATNQVTAKVKVGPDPERRVAGFGAVWVGDPAAEAVWRIDAATNRVVAKISTGPATFGVGATSNAIWAAVSHDGLVVKIDPRTNRILAKVRYAPATDEDVVARVVADAGYVWVEDRDTLFRIDATTNQVIARTALPGRKGRSDGEVALGAGAVWVTNAENATVVRVDTATNKVVATIDVLAQPAGIAFNADGVWVNSRNNGDVVVSRIDPATNKRVAEVTAGTGSDDLWVDDGSVWTVAREDQRIERIDP